MDDESTEGVTENANVVGIQKNANTIGVQPNPFLQSFPTEWKNVCLEMLRAFKEERRERLGYKRLGWGHIRDLIMKDQDVYKNEKLFERDSRLRRQDLEAWERGAIPTDSKFVFIDAFIRMIEIDEESEGIRELLLLRKDEDHARVLREMYLKRSTDNSYAKQILEACSPYLYSEKVKNDSHHSIVLKICSEHHSVIKIIAAYCPVPLDDLDAPGFKNVSFYDGFIIPMSNRGERKSDLIAAKIMLVSAQFQGSKVHGYADGELTIALSIPSLSSDRVILGFPRPLSDPVFRDSKMHFDRHYADFQKKKLIRLEFLDRNTSKFDNLFSTCYSGYIF